MYNQQQNYQSSGITANSQFRGMQKQQYEPVGQVQSYYQGIGQFHSSNYRGDQVGHDAYLRADSTTPSQYGGSSQSGFQNTGRTASMSSQFGIQGQVGQGQTNQFHSANYRGNQQGHDSYLRADSTQPSNIQ